MTGYSPASTQRVVLGDGVEGLRSLPPGSVDLVLTDLPSGETRASFDREVDLRSFWPAVWHALRPDGQCVVMASSLAFAADVLASQRESYRYERVWRKTIATGHLNARRRPLRTHEYVLVFWRRQGVYVPQMTRGHGPVHAARRTTWGENYGPHTRVTESRAGATDRFPTSVLDFASVGTTSSERVHPQQKPADLLSDLVLTYSRPGDLVVDPFAGSGATGEAAVRCGRRTLMWDSDPRFGSRQEEAPSQPRGEGRTG